MSYSDNVGKGYPIYGANGFIHLFCAESVYWGLIQRSSYVYMLEIVGRNGKQLDVDALLQEILINTTLEELNEVYIDKILQGEVRGS